MFSAHSTETRCILQNSLRTIIITKFERGEDHRLTTRLRNFNLKAVSKIVFFKMEIFYISLRKPYELH